MLQEIGMYTCGLVCSNVCGGVVSVRWVWGWLNEQLLAPAETAAISLVSFILPYTLLCCSNIYSNYCPLVANRDGNGNGD